MHDPSTCPCDNCDTARIIQKGNERTRLYNRAAKRKSRKFPEPTRPAPAACECCGLIPKGCLRLDHCHITGKFRGWLCDTCNRGLGMFGDSVAGVRKVLSYLERAT